MKIPRESGQPPVFPDAGKVDSGAKSQSKAKSITPDLKKTAEDLTKATESSVSKLLRAGGGAADFATVGMKVLTQAAEGVTSATGKVGEGVGKAAAGKATEAAAHAGGSAAEQAWRNVGQSIFGVAANVSKEVAAGASAIGKHVAEARFDKAAAAMTETVEGTQSLDINQLIQSALRGAYSENLKDLQFYADKVKLFNSMKSDIRDELTKMRDFQSSGTSAGDGVRSEWEEAIGNLEEKLATVGDDAQLANIDLQNSLQKAQQTLQTMSNVSKMLHDTGMAIIRKIG